jgi:hypothetical protein
MPITPPLAGRSPARGLHRREFLYLGSVLALTPWLAGAADAASIAAKPLSVGVFEGSDRWQRVDPLPWQLRPSEKQAWFPIDPAAALSMGDTNLLYRTVLVTVHGLYPSRAESCPEIDAAGLEVLFPSLDPNVPGPFPFYAWAFKRKPGWNAGQRVSFPIGIEGDGLLRLALLVRWPGVKGTAARVERFEANLTVGREPGQPKLMRGIYLLGLSPGSWDSPKALAAPGVKNAAVPCSLAISIDPIPE